MQDKMNNLNQNTPVILYETERKVCTLKSEVYSQMDPDCMMALLGNQKASVLMKIQNFEN